MRPSSFFSISFFFLFFLLINENTSPVNAISADLINTTCNQCAEKSSILNYTFCVTSLEAIFVSHFTNLPGLAVIAMELALGNATSTILTIEKMMTSGKLDPLSMDCLGDCLELYADAITLVVDATAAFFTKHFDAASMLMNAVMEVPMTCEEGFKVKEGEVSPLMKENYNLFELSDVSLCIINLVALNLGSNVILNQV